MESSTLKSTLRIAMVGDYNHDVLAHRAIPLAIDDAAAVLDVTADYDWIATREINSPEDLVGYDAIWVVPATPYQNEQGAFTAIRYARENAVPFLGTCGGFQYAIVEYARNVLGWDDAGHAESGSDGRLVVAPLACELVEVSDTIEFRPNTLIAKAYGRLETEEQYHASYGVSLLFASELEQQPLKVSGWDREGDIRAVELVTHPFFVATLFQHERASLSGRPAPLVQAFLHAARQ